MPIILAVHEAEVGGLWSEANLGKSVRLYLKKQTKIQGAEGVTHMVECLLSKCEALSSKPSTIKK
jgi:hypothetical protein